MRNTKAILAGALIAPALALGGGLAYATTTPGTAPARTSVTSTAQDHSQHPATQPHHSYCGWRYGDQRCDWRGHSHQRHAAHRHAAHGHNGYRGTHGCQRHHSYGHHGRNGGYGYGGYQGSWRYGGGWGNGGGCCGHGW
jgi:hypothetical protein